MGLYQCKLGMGGRAHDFHSKRVQQLGKPCIGVHMALHDQDDDVDDDEGNDAKRCR